MPAQQATTPGELDLVRPLFRIHFWGRLLFLAHAWILNALWLPLTSHAGLALAVEALLLPWTLLTAYAYAHRRLRTAWLMGLDAAVTLLVVAVTVPVRGAAWTSSAGETLAGYWIAGAPLALAIQYGWLAGGCTALLLGLAAFAARPDLDPSGWGSLLVLFAATAGLGYLVGVIRGQVAERDAVYAKAAALGERERLSRIVHDGVLQVLAMVEREGPALGPRGVALARAAREQEGSLRALLQDRDVDAIVGPLVTADRTNLSSALDRLAGPDVVVSTIADDVLLPRLVVDEILAVVKEALSNTAKHGGADARAWILLERDDSGLTLTVRDNGVGADPREILQAAGNGRLGVRQSIVGRLHDLGGHATLQAAAGRGVEWECWIPWESE